MTQGSAKKAGWNSIPTLKPNHRTLPMSPFRQWNRRPLRGDGVAVAATGA
jgi:hypothetical protein